MLALAMQFSRFPARALYPPCRTCRPVRDPGRASWRGARGSRRRRSLKAQQCVRPGPCLPPFPTPCGAVLGEPASGPTE
jgi:hypothetical protein